MSVFVEGGKPECQEKNPRSRDKSNNKLSPYVYDVNIGNRTRVTLVGGECFHHCAIHAPLVNVKQLGGVKYTLPRSLLASTPQDFPVNAMFVTSLANDHKAQNQHNTIKSVDIERYIVNSSQIMIDYYTNKMWHLQPMQHFPYI